MRASYTIRWPTSTNASLGGTDGRILCQISIDVDVKYSVQPLGVVTHVWA